MIACSFHCSTELFLYILAQSLLHYSSSSAISTTLLPGRNPLLWMSRELFSKSGLGPSSSSVLTMSPLELRRIEWMSVFLYTVQSYNTTVYSLYNICCDITPYANSCLWIAKICISDPYYFWHGSFLSSTRSPMFVFKMWWMEISIFYLLLLGTVYICTVFPIS